MNFSLNYVWIQAVRLPVPEEGQTITCPIPDGLMDNVVHTAERFPQLQSNIWVDIYGIGNHPDPIMQALNKTVDVPNITFKPLDSLAAYRINPLFEKPSVDITEAYDPLWQQVDLARLYALRNELVMGDLSGAVYADMDRDITEEVLIKVGSILDNFGLVAARNGEGAMVENQFMGFTRQRLDFLTHTHILHSADTIAEGKNGWHGHLRAVDEFRTRYLDGRDYNVIIVREIPEAKVIKNSYQKLPEPVGLAQPSPTSRGLNI